MHRFTTILLGWGGILSAGRGPSLQSTRKTGDENVNHRRKITLVANGKMPHLRDAMSRLLEQLLQVTTRSPSTIIHNDCLEMHASSIARHSPDGIRCQAENSSTVVVIFDMSSNIQLYSVHAKTKKKATISLERCGAGSWKDT